MTRPALVIFDCDGTLVDSQHMIAAAMGEAFEGLGLPAPPLEAVRQTVGLSLREAVSRLLPAEALELAAAGEAGYRDAFIAMRARGDTHEPLYPGVRALLETLSEAGLRLAVATGKGRAGLDKTLALHGLSELFCSLQTADGHPGKPHPSMVEAALREGGVPASRALVIGDTHFDMEMAARAGVTALGVGWGYHSAEALRAAGAAEVFDGAEALGAWTLRWALD